MKFSFRPVCVGPFIDFTASDICRSVASLLKLSITYPSLSSSFPPCVFLCNVTRSRILHFSISGLSCVFFQVCMTILLLSRCIDHHIHTSTGISRSSLCSFLFHHWYIQSSRSHRFPFLLGYNVLKRSTCVLPAFSMSLIFRLESSTLSLMFFRSSDLGMLWKKWLNRIHLFCTNFFLYFFIFRRSSLLHPLGRYTGVSPFSSFPLSFCMLPEPCLWHHVWISCHNQNIVIALTFSSDGILNEDDSFRLTW